jgi:hypothetical protein
MRRLRRFYQRPWRLRALFCVLGHGALKSRELSDMITSHNSRLFFRKVAS